MSMMGYDVYAQASGGYPTGYLKAASDVDLFKKCSGSATLKYSDMFFMMENALKGDTITADFSGKTYSKNKDKNLLKQYYDMYYEKGTVTGANTVDIETGRERAEDVVIIDGKEYLTEVDMFDYLGCQVDFVYYDDGSNDPKIVWSRMRDGNEILEISADFDCRFDDTNYTFEYTAENSSRRKKLQLSRGISVVYNGELVESGIDTLFGTDRFEMKLVKQRGEKDYSLAVIWAYENYFVGNIDDGKKLFMISKIREEVFRWMKTSMSIAI